MRRTMTLKEWEEHLLKWELEALKDYEFTENELINPSEVFETIIQWNGGIATAYEIKSIISRVYGIELQ